MKRIFIVVEGGCVRYVATDSSSLAEDAVVEVIDLDDLRDEPDAEASAKLAEAESHLRIW